MWRARLGKHFPAMALVARQPSSSSRRRVVEIQAIAYLGAMTSPLLEPPIVRARARGAASRRSRSTGRTRLNALTFEIYRELAETFEQLDRDDAVRAIVITGRGRGFCSGGDQDDIIKHLLGRDTPGAARVHARDRAADRGDAARAGGRSSRRSTASRSARAR